MLDRSRYLMPVLCRSSSISHKRPHIRQGQHRVHHGQVMVLFVISIVALISVVGLSIDGLRIYISYAQTERAAEAAALAAAPYVDFPTSANPAPDGNNATNRAYQEAAKNGVTDSTTITVTVHAMQRSVQVAIRVSVGLTFLGLLNSSSINSTVNASAVLLSPIAIGANTNSLQNPNGALMASIGGVNELEERSDPYTAACQDGWTDASDSLHADAAWAMYLTRLWTDTNAPQYTNGPLCSPGSPGNPDRIPAGFSGLATTGTSLPNGQNYLITIPPGGTGFSVWIYNPRFIFTGNASSGSMFFPDEGEFIQPNYDNPDFYPHIAYTLYSVPEVYNRGADTPIGTIWPYSSAPNTAPFPPFTASQWMAIPPLDASSPDLSNHGCSSAWNLHGGSFYYPPIDAAKGCVSMPADYQNWVQIPGSLSASSTNAGFYRMTVDTVGGYGQHTYGIRVCQNGATATTCIDGGATLSGWNAMTIAPQGGNNTFPLVNIPSAYAGRQVQLSLFNPGVNTGNVTIQLISPDSNASVLYPAYLRLVSATGGQAIQTSFNGDELYHNKWITVVLNLPPAYTGGMWTFQYAATSSGPIAPMTIRTILLGNPVVLTATS